VFRFISMAEEELYLQANRKRQEMLDAHGVWMPRVEAHMKYLKPIRNGSAIRVRIDAQFPGEKSVRYDFEIIDDETAVLLAQGFLTVVCVDQSTFKSKALPGEIKRVLGGS
jgi:acyl-CoA thioesterase FadM